jgi:hypothetical protein
MSPFPSARSDANGHGTINRTRPRKTEKINEKKGITIWKYYRVAVLHFPDCEPLSHFCVILELQAMKGS